MIWAESPKSWRERECGWLFLSIKHFFVLPVPISCSEAKINLLPRSALFEALIGVFDSRIKNILPAHFQNVDMMLTIYYFARVAFFSFLY